MECRVEGCDRAARYKAEQLCQKHYFRLWRYGTTDLTRSRKYRLANPQGYQWIYEPNHPLRHVTSGYVAEHRAVLYERIGDREFGCELCGKALTWASCHVDHIDNDVTNNGIENLRPTCSTCNTRRGMRPPAEWERTHTLEFDGERKTAAEWSRDSRVNLSGTQIVLRKRAGMGDEEALFAPKKTHNGKKRVSKTGRSFVFSAIEIDGITMTASQWSRHPDCHVSDVSIRLRIKKGMCVRDAVFSPRADR